MSETLTYEDGWLPMDAAPVAEPVEIRAGGMVFKAMLVPDAALDTNENPCDQWQAAVEGEHPPCWSDGCCWTVNENEDRSAWPEAWRPLTSPSPAEEG